MKIVICIPDRLFEAADKVARCLGISRNKLYRRAIGHFLEQQTGDVVRGALDAVYGRQANRDLDPLVKMSGEYTLIDENW